MESTRLVAWLFIVVVMLSFATRSKAWLFYVGGKDGWVQNPSEDYNHWAERNRFQVNDTLFFKYEKGKDSVLLVTKDAYSSCNTSNPLVALTDGASRLKFDRSGPFFFISGVAGRCNAGQKLIVVVLAVRPKTPGGAPAPPPASPVLPPPSPAGMSPQPAAASPSDASAPVPAPSRNSASQVGFSFGGGVGLMIALGVSFLIGG